MEIVIALGSFGVRLGLDRSRGDLDRNKRLRAAQLRRIFTRLGPTFVKLGQGLSTRPDLCPPEYLEELSQLQVRVFSFPFPFQNDQYSMCSKLINYESSFTA